MKEPTYRDALKAGYDLAWHHKSLWLFGLFAAFLGQMGFVELIAKITRGVATTSSSSALVYMWNLLSVLKPSAIAEQLEMSVDKWVWLLWLVVIFAGFALMLLFISVVSQGAIVHSTARYIDKKGKKFEDADVSWHASRVHFWRLLVLNILRKVLTISFVIFATWGMYNAIIFPRVGDILLFLLLFLLATVMGMILSFLLVYAVGYVVVENQKLIPALQNAWRMFTDHWFVSLEIGFIMIVLNVLALALVIFGLYVFFLPSLFMWTIAVVFHSQALFMAGVIVGFILFALYMALIASMFTVFTTATWTYLFTKMHKKGVVSRLVHLFHGSNK
ncbi:MAG: hypothetical protein HYV41_01530 [Candidatus Magasanikbacteria bacterium]|nr:hypothetical protein [Candidatus Magasanikbacteria bacterium]